MNQTIDLRAEQYGINQGPGRQSAAATGAPGGLWDLLKLMGAEVQDRRLVAEIAVAVRRVHEGGTLLHEGSRAEAIYFVRAGTFKTFSTAQDGYEQVLGFAGRGEVLGFDAICRGCYPNEALALEDSSVYVVLLHDYFELGQRVAALDRVVFRAVSAALTRRGELADVMAAVAAEVRLARFLMHLSEPMAAAGQSWRRFHLRMGRRDIASYLGVAHETVSRSFGALAGLGLLRVDNREVEILDLDGLRSFACGTRRQPDEAARHSNGAYEAAAHAGGQLLMA